MATRDNAKRNMMILFGLAVAAGMLALGAVVPRIESARLRATREALEHVERGRRLLDQYDTSVTVEAQYRGLYGDEGFTLTSEQANDLLQHPDFDVAAKATDELSEYVRKPQINSLPQAEQAFLKLLHGEQRWSEHASAPAPTRVSGPGMMNSGGRTFEQLLKDNQRLLDAALAEANAALNITYGDYSMRQNAGANRLSGAVHYQQGLESARKALLMRNLLAQRRLQIKLWSEELDALQADVNVVADSGIDQHILEAQTAADAAQAAVQQQAAEVSRLRGVVAERSNRVAAAASRSETAREIMETLQDLGVDLSNPRGFEEFRAAFNEQAAQYRAALAEAHALEFGTLDNAVIDASGDYLHGQYLPSDPTRKIELHRGLKHLENDLASADAALQQMQDAANKLAGNTADLQELKSNLEQRALIATESSAKLKTQIEEALSGFIELDRSVRGVEDEAIQMLDKAASAFKTALQGVMAEEREASERKPSDPERARFHYSAVAGDQGWLQGQLLAEQADTLLRQAVVLVGRCQDARDESSDLSRVQAALLQREGRTDLDATRQDAIAKIESAIDELQSKAKSKIGDGNWTVASEIGAAYYLLSLLGVEMAHQKAIAWYNAAVESRESSAPEHAWIRDYLQKRGG